MKLTMKHSVFLSCVLLASACASPSSPSVKDQMHPDGSASDGVSSGSGGNHANGDARGGGGTQGGNGGAQGSGGAQGGGGMIAGQGGATTGQGGRAGATGFG